SERPWRKSNDNARHLHGVNSSCGNEARAFGQRDELPRAMLSFTCFISRYYTSGLPLDDGYGCIGVSASARSKGMDGKRVREQPYWLCTLPKGETTTVRYSITGKLRRTPSDVMPIERRLRISQRG